MALLLLHGIAVLGCARSGFETLLPPDPVIATAVSPFQINLQWTSPRCCDDGFRFIVVRDDTPIAETASCLFADAGTDLAAGREYGYQVHVKAISGRRSDPSESVFVHTLEHFRAEYTAYRASSPPVVDCDLTDLGTAWPALLFVPNSGNRVVTRLLWDDTTLHVGMQVSDSDLWATAVARDDSAMWSDDCIEWFFDGDNDAPELAPSARYMDSDDVQLIVNANSAVFDARGVDDAPEIVDSTWDAAWNICLRRHGTLGNAADEDRRYDLEFSISWLDLGVEPTVGAVYGMSFTNADTDATSRSWAMWPDLHGGLVGSLVAHQNASNWQTLILSGELIENGCHDVDMRPGP